MPIEILAYPSHAGTFLHRLWNSSTILMRDSDHPPPKVIATVGMHGSASTWVFNVVRELMIAALGELNALACYAEQIPEIALRSDQHLVIKSHHGTPELENWLGLNNASYVVSLRDPRDASISMAQRFKTPLQTTVRWIANDCARLRRLAATGCRLLRYEDRFFDNAQEVPRIASELSIVLERSVLSDIFERYRTNAVRALASRLTELPKDRVMSADELRHDKVTQIWSRHIGDGQSGKWRHLRPADQVEITRFFEPFLREFGYPTI